MDIPYYIWINLNIYNQWFYIFNAAGKRNVWFLEKNCVANIPEVNTKQKYSIHVYFTTPKQRLTCNIVVKER